MGQHSLGAHGPGPVSPGFSWVSPGVDQRRPRGLGLAPPHTLLGPACHACETQRKEARNPWREKQAWPGHTQGKSWDSLPAAAVRENPAVWSGGKTGRSGDQGPAFR